MAKRKSFRRNRKAYMKEKGRTLGKSNKIDTSTAAPASPTAPIPDIKIELEELDISENVDIQAQATEQSKEGSTEQSKEGSTEQSKEGSEDIQQSVAQVCADTSLPSDASDNASVTSFPLLNNIIPYIMRENLVVSSPLVNVERDTKIYTISPPEPWTVSKSLCRCCHAEGDFDSMTSAHGDEPSPDDILRNVFNIQLCPTAGPGKSLRSICTLCLARLCDAYHFLQQVRACDQHFAWMWNSGRVKVHKVPDVFRFAEVKLEPPDDRAGSEPMRDDTGSTNRQVKKKRNNEVPAPQRFRCSVQIGDVFKCVKCDMSAASATQVRLHYHAAHTRLPCDRCELTFRTLIQLKNHKLESHEIDERCKCNACGKSFNTKSQVKKHQDTVHMMGVRVKCPMCSFETYGQARLKRHLIKHTGPRKYHCKYCTKSFRRPKTLDYHQRIHTGDKRQKCGECGETFVQKSSLNYHMTKYHPEVRF